MHKKSNIPVISLMKFAGNFAERMAALQIYGIWI
jgi:hypothetical protein